MNKKQLREIIIAMMYTAGLDPLIEDDYYQNISVSCMIKFLDGVVGYFEIPRDSWMVHFASIGYLDTPSETIKFFQRNIDILMAFKNGEEVK